MNVSKIISQALKTQGHFEDGEVNAGQIFKGYAYNGVTENNGWHFQPFNRQPIFLGKNKDEALETIENWDEN